MTRLILDAPASAKQASFRMDSGFSQPASFLAHFNVGAMPRIALQCTDWAMHGIAPTPARSRKLVILLVAITLLLGFTVGPIEAQTKTKKSQSTNTKAKPAPAANKNPDAARVLDPKLFRGRIKT